MKTLKILLLLLFQFTKFKSTENAESIVKNRKWLNGKRNECEEKRPKWAPNFLSDLFDRCPIRKTEQTNVTNKCIEFPFPPCLGYNFDVLRLFCVCVRCACIFLFIAWFAVFFQFIIPIQLPLFKFRLLLLFFFFHFVFDCMLFALTSPKWRKKNIKHVHYRLRKRALAFRGSIVWK